MFEAASSSSSTYQGTSATKNVSRLSELITRIYDITLRKADVDVLHDSYHKERSASFAREKLLAEESNQREKVRLERQRQKEHDRGNKFDLKGISVSSSEKAEEEFPELSREAEELIHRAWSRGDPNDTFEGTCNLTRNDYHTLKGLNWLNDEIMNGYLELVCKRSNDNAQLPKVYAFNSFFYQNLCTRGYSSVKRWTRKVDVFSFDLLLVTVHLSVHWCMAIVDMREKRMDYYDSMGRDNEQCMEMLRLYLREESMDKKKCSLSFDGWEYNHRKDIPHQANGSDCGVFALKFGDFGARRKSVEFSQKDMQYYRRRMVVQLWKGDLGAH